MLHRKNLKLTAKEVSGKHRLLRILVLFISYSFAILATTHLLNESDTTEGNSWNLLWDYAPII